MSETNCKSTDERDRLKDQIDRLTQSNQELYDLLSGADAREDTLTKRLTATEKALLECVVNSLVIIGE